MANLKVTQNREYDGPTDGAPQWVRWAVVPWYRRIITAPLTISIVIIVGLIEGHGKSGWEYALFLPTYFLLYHVVLDANRLWYRYRFEENEVLASEKRV